MNFVSGWRLSEGHDCKRLEACELLNINPVTLPAAVLGFRNQGSRFRIGREGEMLLHQHVKA